MRCLAADHDKKRLDLLSGYIKEIFPDGELIAETDSLMAGKMCFSEKYDIVFANLDDRRLDGLKMKDFVRHCNPDAKFILCGNEKELYDWNIIDENGRICEYGVDGAVSYPLTKDKIMKSLTFSENEVRLGDDMLD